MNFFDVKKLSVFIMIISYLGFFNLDLCLFLGGCFFLRIGILWDHHFPTTILVFPFRIGKVRMNFHGRSL